MLRPVGRISVERTISPPGTGEMYCPASASIKALMDALAGQYISPVPGGDIVRSTDILPTGRNIHAFDPFRMPTVFACRQGEIQAELLLKTHKKIPQTVATV